ncbi:hypothetical protein H7171_03505 [Candidatus Saccharibacteria bacterium]|nr:hypothetical protein [Candidatus Saccharibacteria bacterium]
MNQLCKPLQRSILSLTVTIFAFGIGAPTIVSALDNTTTKVGSGTAKISSFCTKLPTTITTIDANFSSRITKLANARVSADQKHAANKTKWDSEIAANRAMWDQKRQTNFTKLEAKGTDATKTTAIKAYEASITGAVDSMRIANSQARETYRIAATNAMTSQRSTVDKQLATFQTAVIAAESTAQANCQATPNDGSSIRIVFQAALKSAREAFTSDRKIDTGLSVQLKQLGQVRDSAFKTSSATYKAAAKTARTTLQLAFGTAKV